MARTKRFVIIMTKEERETIGRLAAAERLPAATYARRRLLQEAEHRGLCPEQPWKESDLVMA